MFEEAAAHVVSVLEADEITGAIRVLRNTTDRYDDILKHTLRTDGICLVVVALSGNLLNPGEELMQISNEISVAVIENPTVPRTGPTLLQVVERVLKVVHNSVAFDDGKGIRNVIVADQLAYENANIDAGPQAYLCNFRYKTILTKQ